jgi:hypothetical protein
MNEVFAVLLPGLALGGALAAAAAWSRGARDGVIPHLGVGALGAVGIAAAGRLAGAGWLPALVAVAAVGCAGGLASRWLDAQVRSRAGLLPDVSADLAVLAAAVVAASVLRPQTAVPLPLGLLGGQPGTAGGLAALAVGLAGVAALLHRAASGLGPTVRWSLFGGLVSVTAVLASGAVGAGGLAALTLPPVTDPGGLALRAGAAALAGRDPADAAAAGVGLGVAEAVLRSVDPLGGLALLPAALAGLLGLAARLRERPQVASHA